MSKSSQATSTATVQVASTESKPRGVTPPTLMSAKLAASTVRGIKVSLQHTLNLV